MVAVNYYRSPARAAEVVAVIEAAGGKAVALGGDVAGTAPPCARWSSGRCPRSDRSTSS